MKANLEGIPLGWLYMIVCGIAVGLSFGAEPRIAFYISLAVFAASFASFCLLYDEPLKRARGRIAERMGRLSGQGVHAEEYQRLQSMAITPTDEDKQFRLTLVSGINVASGIAGLGMLVWAVLIRLL